MSTIISLSLNDEIIKQIDTVQKERGFSGRSETIRAAVRLLVDEHQERKKSHGVQNAVLIVVHDERHSEEFALARHKFLKVIRTQLHDHLENHECMELMVLRGDAKELVKLAETCERCKGVKSAKMVGV